MRDRQNTIAIANFDSADLAPELPKMGNIHSAIANCARVSYPRKTWASLASMLRLTERGAKHRLSGTRRFTADEIALLLRSEDGFNYLVAVMANSEPPWWRAFKRHMRVTNATRVQLQMRRELEEAMNADAALASTVTRQDAALVQDADFYRPHFDALGTMARTPDRTMVQAKGRK